MAVLRLQSVPPWCGCWTGRSAGFSPLRTRPVYAPACRYASKAAARVTHQTASYDERARIVDRGNPVAKRQRGELRLMCNEESIARYHKPPDPKLNESFERGVDIASALAFRTWSSSPSVRAATCRLLDRVSALGLVGLTRAATVVAVGTTSCSTSRSFGPTSTFRGSHP